MSKRRIFKMSLILLSFCLLGLTCSLAAEPGTADLTEEQENGLKAAIGKHRGELTKDQKDALGATNVRSTYSKLYKPQDDGSMKVTVMVDHAAEALMTTERHEWLFKPTNAERTKWEFVEDKMADSWQSLERFDGDQVYYSFESMSFDKGGLEVSSGPGEVIQNLIGGKPVGMLVVAQGLQFKYSPPNNTSFDAKYFNDVHGILETDPDRKDDMNFEPLFLSLNCDSDTCEQLLKETFAGLKSDGNHKLSFNSLNLAAGGGHLSDKGARALRSIYKDFAENRKKNGFSGFGNGPREGNHYWDLRVHRDQDYLLGLQYDNWEGFELQFYTNKLGMLYGYYTDETLAETPPYELELRDDKQTRDFHVDAVVGTVDVAILDEERIEGDLEIRLIAKRDLDELPFFIINNTGNKDDQNERTRLFVNALQLDGEELTIARFGFGGFAKLPRTIKNGETMNVRINYSTQAMRKVNPSFISVSRGGWMPFVSFGDMIPEFDLTMRYPSKYKLLGIGKKRSLVTNGRITTAQWKADRPVVFASFTLGKYIDDEPKIEAKKIDGTIIPVVVHVDETSTNKFEVGGTSFEKFQNSQESFGLGGRGIRVKQLRSIGEQAVNSINLYREISGVDYPYGELNIVADPQGTFYGQAPSSLIYLGFGVFRGEGMVAADFGGGTQIAKFNKSVVAHEVGHQWWGATITNANSRNYWFVETMAEYFSAIFLEQVYGRQEYLEQVDEWRRNILRNSNLSSVQNASSSFSDGSYQALVYNKGPYAFHMLRQIFGDEKFFPMLKTFTQTLAAKGEIVTRDIQTVAEEALGGIGADGEPYKMDLSWFFDQWIRGIGVPEYRFQYTVRETEDGGAIISGKVFQRMMAGDEQRRVEIASDQYRAKVPITILGKDKKEYSVPVIIQGAETPFQFKVPSPPLEVTLNKYMESLAYDVVIDN